MQRARLGHCGWAPACNDRRAAPRRLLARRRGPQARTGDARGGRARVLTPRAHCSARLLFAEKAPPDAGSCPGHVCVLKKSVTCVIFSNRRQNFEIWRSRSGFKSIAVSSLSPLAISSLALACFATQTRDKCAGSRHIPGTGESTRSNRRGQGGQTFTLCLLPGRFPLSRRSPLSLTRVRTSLGIFSARNWMYGDAPPCLSDARRE